MAPANPVVTLRLVAPADAEALSALQRRDRDHLAAGAPVRTDAWRSPEGQRASIAQRLADHAVGLMQPMVIEHDGEVVGMVELAEIVRGPAQWASLGYWLGRHATGRGIATEAVRQMLGRAFGELALHRVHAAVAVDNPASARVLERNGFREHGFSPRHLRFASAGGGWADCRLFEILADEWEAGLSAQSR